MNMLRAILRLAAFVGLTVGLYLARLVRRDRAGRRWLFRNWARAMSRIVGMRVAVEGEPPRPPFLLVSNHLSYVDIVLLAAHLDCVFVAKHDVRNWPLLGLMVRNMDTIFIDRANRRDLLRVSEQIDQALQAGDGVVLFAEGTSTRGERVNPFRPALLEQAASARLPVHYASVSYRVPVNTRPAHESVCWWGDMTFRDHFFDLLKLPHFEARVVFGAEPIQDTDRKHLARRLHRRIQDQFIPVVTPLVEAK